MSNQILNGRVIQRNDTSANWASINPILLKGEMGVESDTKKFKFGDGTTAWNSLEYAMSGGLEIATQAEAEAGVVDNKVMTPLKTKEAVAAQNQGKADLVDGKVPAEQLPEGIALLNSPSFSGTPTAPTAAKTVNNTQLATTAFVHLLAGAANNGGVVDSLLAQNGYVKFANGLVLQWGTNTAASSPSGVTISYPLAFSSAVYSVAIVPEGGNQTSKWGVSSITTSNFKYYRADGSPTASRWIAVGK